MADFYLFLNSEATTEYKKNYIFDFFLTLPNSIDFNRELWEIGVVDICIKSNITLPEMLLCSNIISSSIVSNGIDQILRFIPEINNSETYLEFNNILYHDIVVRVLDRMRVYIRPMSSVSLSLASGTLYCTVHIRKKNKHEIY